MEKGMERGRNIGSRLLEELEELFQDGRPIAVQFTAGTGCFRALIKWFIAGVSFFCPR